MSEQLKPNWDYDLPSELVGAYSSLGNRHTYIIDDQGKKRVISWKAFKAKWPDPPEYPGRTPEILDPSMATPDGATEAQVDAHPVAGAGHDHTNVEDDHASPDGESPTKSAHDDTALIEYLWAAQRAKRDDKVAAQKNAENAFWDEFNRLVQEGRWSIDEAKERRAQFIAIINDDSKDPSTKPASSETTDTDTPNPGEPGSVEPDDTTGVPDTPVVQVPSSTPHGGSDNIVIPLPIGDSGATSTMDEKGHDSPATLATDTSVATLEGEAEPTDDTLAVGATPVRIDSGEPDDDVDPDLLSRWEDLWSGGGAQDGDHLPTDTAPEEHLDSVFSLGMPAQETDSALLMDYNEARDRYIEAHANARSDLLGALAVRLAGRNKWLGERFNRYSEDRKTRVFELQQAKKAFGPIYKDDLDRAVERDESYSGLRQIDRRAHRDAAAAYRLELAISARRREMEREKPLSRKAALALGLGAAAVAGALVGSADRWSKGDWTAPLAVAAGGIAGLSAAKSARSESEADAIDRARDARRMVMRSYGEGDDPEANNDKVFGLDAIGSNTWLVQSNEVGRYVAAAAAGAGTAYLGYVGGEHLSDWSVNQVPNIEGAISHVSSRADDGVRHVEGTLDHAWNWVTDQVKDVGRGIDHIWSRAVDQMKDINPPTNHPASEATAPASTHATAAATATAPAPTAAPTHEVIAQVPTHEVSTPATIVATPASTGGEVVRSTPASSDTVFELQQIHQGASYVAGEVAGKAAATVNPIGSTGVISPRGGADVSGMGDKINTLIGEGREKVAQAITVMQHAGDKVHNEVRNAGERIRDTVSQFFEIKRGDGFTDLLERYAASHGYKLTDGQAAELYKCLTAPGQFDPKHLLIDGNSYPMSGGGWGVDKVEMDRWTPAVQEAIDKWLAAHASSGV